MRSDVAIIGGGIIGAAIARELSRYNLRITLLEKAAEIGVGYLQTVDGKTVYHAGDTDFIEEMKARAIDLALLPSGDTYTRDNPDDVEAALAIAPTAVIPMHRWDTSSADFKRAVEGRSSPLRSSS